MSFLVTVFIALAIYFYSNSFVLAFTFIKYASLSKPPHFIQNIFVYLQKGLLKKIL